ncbi:elongin-A-like isoform X2 [Argopecten irradians]|uniref:elongin-A-like isoform X2 n=1 Tax=Argopecten irradians TaxID=31199 RepID=UPI003713BD14
MATKEKSHSTTEADVEHKVLKYKSYLETNQNGNKKTGIGKVVNSFRKRDGEIGQLAKDIVAKWKSMVAVRLEAEEETRESDNRGSESELENDNKDEDLDHEDDEVDNIENVDNNSKGDEGSSNCLSDDERKIEEEEVQNHKLKSYRYKDHQTSDQNHTSSDSKHRSSDSKHRSSDGKHRSSESKHRSSESKHTHSDSKHKHSDSKHTHLDSKHSSFEHKVLDSKHKSSEDKHKSSNSKHKSSDSKHKSSESKQNGSENKLNSSDHIKNKSKEKKHKTENDGRKEKSSEKTDNSEASHKDARNDDKHAKHKDKEQKKSTSFKHNTESSSKTESSEKYSMKSSGQQCGSSEKKTFAKKTESSQENELDDRDITSVTSKNVILSSSGKILSSDVDDKVNDSDDDPLHWEMLESFEQEKTLKVEQSREEKNQEDELVKQQNVISDSMVDSGSGGFMDSKLLKNESKHSKDNDSKHKHRDESDKLHHRGQKESSLEKDGHRDKSSKSHHRDKKESSSDKKNDRDGSSKSHHDKKKESLSEKEKDKEDSEHKHKHSKHKHKHSGKDKEHKHSRGDKSDKREIMHDQVKKESGKEAAKTELSTDKGQTKERSCILESLSSEVDQGTFSDDVPGLWFLNSNNNSFMEDGESSKLKSSKLEMPSESSGVKVESDGKDKKQSDKNLLDKTSENDKKDRKKHKHSKERESSSKKHKSHKDSKSHHDSKHKDKKRKHSGDADDKPSKSRRTSSQDRMSFEDLLTAGVSNKKTSQSAKLSQNDYAQLKSKFKVKKKGDNSFNDSTNIGSKIKVTDEEILGALPQPNTHYRPWRLKEVEKKKTEEELLDEFIASTKTTGRTQMYSGKKQNFVPEVYKLYDMCMTVLCNNIDSLEFVGGVPYEILKPVLEKCTAAQLYRLEDFNPHFLADTDPLWMNHCHKEFRLSKPDEMETWREHYLRKFDEREEKLKKISANINASMAKKVPERTTQLAYIDSAAKPPRNVRRQQAKYGTAGPSSGERSRARFLPSMDPIPVGRSKPVKTSAPMMAKTLTMIKKMRR